MDSNLRTDADWADVLASGSADIERALRLTQLKPGAALRLLEIGCGMGRTTAALAPLFGEIVAVDVSADLLQAAKNCIHDKNVRFVCVADPDLADFPAESFDAVFSCEVFHHLDHDVLTAYVRAARRVLRPGGQFIFQINAVPRSRWTTLSSVFRTALYRLGVPEWRGWPNHPGFRRRVYSLRFLTDMLRNAGFSIQSVSTADMRDVWYSVVRE